MVSLPSTPSERQQDVQGSRCTGRVDGACNVIGNDAEFDIAYFGDLEAESISLLPKHEPSWWLRSQLERFRARRAEGQTLNCRHVLTDAHAAACAVLWMPQVIVCAGCAARTFTLPAASNRSCDRCGRRDAGLRRAAAMHQGTYVLFELCPSCVRREVPA